MSLGAAHFKDFYATSFNGSSQYVYRDNPSFKANTAGAFSFWWKPTATLTGTDTSTTIIGYGTNDAANNSFFAIRQRLFLYVHPTNNYISILHRTTAGGATNQVIFTTTPLVAGTTYQVVVASNGTAWTCSINGVSQAVTVGVGSNTGDWFGDVSGTDHKLCFAGFWNFNAINAIQYNACALNDTLYLPSRVFTAGEITEVYNAGVVKNPRSLSMASELEVWRMGDRGDTSSTILGRYKGNNMTTVGSPTYVTP